jgi:hypothetical protein
MPSARVPTLVLALALVLVLVLVLEAQERGDGEVHKSRRRGMRNDSSPAQSGGGGPQLTILDASQAPKVDISDKMRDSLAGMDDFPAAVEGDRFQRMEAALRGLPDEEQARLGLDSLLEGDLSGPERDEALEALWKVRQAEIKAVMDSMVKPADLLTSLIGHIEGEDEDMALEAMEALVDLLSDMDMARDFITLGGWPAVSRRLSLDESEQVRAASAWVVGTAVQNADEFQRRVLERDESGSPSTLERLLDNVAHRPGPEEEQGLNVNLLSKLVFALGSALRNSEDVQSSFHMLHGLGLLGDLYDELLPAHGLSQRRLRIKMLTLVGDLLAEQTRDVVPTGDMEPWCARMHSLFLEDMSTAQLDRVLQAVMPSVQQGTCKQQLLSLGTPSALQAWHTKYVHIAHAPGLDEEGLYAAEVGSLIEEISKLLDMESPA